MGTSALNSTLVAGLWLHGQLYPQPMITACRGDVVRLDAGAGFSAYQWSTGSTTSFTNVTVSSTYAVTVTNEAGCRATGRAVVNFNPLPTVSLGNDQNLCQGSSLSLSAASGFEGYLWSTGDTTATIVVSVLTGTYLLKVSTGSRALVKRLIVQ